jgi:putative tryptophan/tyrosine transport system substrate-binding protein
MRRRDFIAGLGAGAALPLAARAQQAAVIGYLGSVPVDANHPAVRAFHRGLAQSGYVEAQNVAIEYRWAGIDSNLYAALAAELVRRKVNVIVTSTTPATLAAKAATTTIPIVFMAAVDPVAAGLVPSLNRPGANVTGVFGPGEALTAKWLELLHEAVPTATTIAALVNEANPPVAEAQSRGLQSAARALGLTLDVFGASRESDFDNIFAMVVARKAGALVIGAETAFNLYINQFAALALRYGVPAIFNNHDFAFVGGLMSYGIRPLELPRTAGIYAGRILNGDKPADLPVQQASKVELIINLKTAKTLGLTFPTALLVRADEVIE